MLRNYSSVCPPWSDKKVPSNTGSRDDLRTLCSWEENSFVSGQLVLNYNSYIEASSSAVDSGAPSDAVSTSY